MADQYDKYFRHGQNKKERIENFENRGPLGHIRRLCHKFLEQQVKRGTQIQQIKRDTQIQDLSCSKILEPRSTGADSRNL